MYWLLYFHILCFFFFFFNDPATTEIYTLSLHDALPVLEGLGVRASFVDTSDIAAVSAAVEPRTKLIFIETPANPTLKLTDIAAISSVARKAGVLLAVDNTFLTAALQPVFEDRKSTRL